MQFLIGADDSLEIVHAHRMLLMTASTRLHQLFRKSMEEKTVKIIIKETTKPAMLEVMRFAYTDEANLNNENCMIVLYAAIKFDIKALVEKTIEFICKNIDEKSVFKIFEDNQDLGSLKINMKCIDYIQK